MFLPLFKHLLSKDTKKVAKQLIELAYLEGKINDRDVKSLTKTIDEVSVSANTAEDSRIEQIRNALPTSSDERFSLIFYIVHHFIKKHGKIDSSAKSLIMQVLSSIHHEKSRLEVLIDSIVSNIDMGHSQQEIFKRLEYLMKPRQVNFN